MPQGRSKWIAVLTLGLVVGVVMGSSTATGALTLPTTTLPGVEVPSVQVPSTPLPSAPAPAPSTPTVSTPTVSTPTVTTPKVSLPSVQVPSTQLPAQSPSGSSGGSSSPSSPTTRLVQTLTGSTQAPSGSSPTGNSLSPSAALPGGSSGPGGTSGPGPGPAGGIPGSGFSGPGGSFGPGGASGGGYWGSGPTGGPGLGGPGGPAGTGFGGAFDAATLATTFGIRSALAPLIGCFYGLSQPERTVLNLRAGFAGQLPHTRRQAASRLNTSPRQIRQTEQQALQKLNGLAQTQGCGAGFGAVTVVNNAIGPAELAISPSLIAFGNPAYQGIAQTSLSRLGTGLEVGSAGSLPASFGDGSTNGSTWAIQLLTIMLLVALVGFRRVVPLAAARLRHGTLPGQRPASLEHLEHTQEELEQAPCEERLAEREREKIAA